MGNICYTAGWHEHWPRQLFPSADGHPRPFSSQSGEYPVFVREASSPDSFSLEPRALICRLKLLINHMVASLDEREAKSKATILDKPMWGLIYLPGPQTPTNNFSQVANIILFFFWGGGFPTNGHPMLLELLINPSTPICPLAFQPRRALVSSRPSSMDHCLARSRMDSTSSFSVAARNCLQAQRLRLVEPGLKMGQTAKPLPPLSLPAFQTRRMKEAGEDASAPSLDLSMQLARAG